ncbi:fatty acid desaturas-like protein [Geopyxis carbonaria]|nr:fatty acid desaturas-like protein [Geopyxis carbonaria]
MGWLKRRTQAAPVDVDVDVDVEDLKSGAAQHVEHAAPAELPFIPATEITSRLGSDLWLVLDNTIYALDTPRARFLDTHPGGADVLRYFAGQDASWQFWRFHAPKDLEMWRGRLAVGRTRGVANRWVDPEGGVKMPTW